MLRITISIAWVIGMLTFMIWLANLFTLLHQEWKSVVVIISFSIICGLGLLIRDFVFGKLEKKI